MNYPIYELFAIRHINTTRDKIRSFASMPVGWHYGQGGPASRDRVIAAIKICGSYLMSRFSATDAFFGLDGEIAVTAYYGDKYIEAIANTDGTFDVRYEVADEETLYRERLSEADAFSTLRGIKNEIWPGSDSSTPAITIRGRGRSTVLPSRILLTMAGHQLYASPALTQVVPQFVNIYQISTKNESLGIHPFSGEYKSRSFRTVAG